MIDPGPGILLIADPFLKDPNFLRTVVFLCESNEEGSFGFVINKFVSDKAHIVSGAILLTLVSTLMPRAEQMWPDMELTLLIYPAQKKFTLKTY
nr:YqgE/AlgH family protein [Chitinophagaceae bacterium]